MLEINIGDSGLELKLIEVNEKECHGVLQALDQTINLLNCCSVCLYCCWVLQILPDAEQRITPVPGEVWWGRRRKTAEPEWCWSHLLCARVWGSVCISLIRPLFLASFHHSCNKEKKNQNPMKSPAQAKLILPLSGRLSCKPDPRF